MAGAAGDDGAAHKRAKSGRRRRELCSAPARGPQRSSRAKPVCAAEQHHVLERAEALGHVEVKDQPTSNCPDGLQRIYATYMDEARAGLTYGICGRCAAQEDKLNAYQHTYRRQDNQGDGENAREARRLPRGYAAKGNDPRDEHGGGQQDAGRKLHPRDRAGGCLWGGLEQCPGRPPDSHAQKPRAQDEGDSKFVAQEKVQKLAREDYLGNDAREPEDGGREKRGGCRRTAPK
jgi:hypothetical protein